VLDESLHRRESNHVKPGEYVTIIAINRPTGYIGSVRTQLQSAGSDASPFQLSFPIPVLLMGPPNLRIWAERTLDVAAGATAGEERNYTIGNEGGGVDDDTLITVFTEWLDQDGRPLPEGLGPYGYTGRLAKLSEPNVLSPVSGSLSQFAIQPGLHRQVIRLKDDGVTREHLYIQVNGSPSIRLPNFGNEGSQHREGRLKYRPDHYVPFKVPHFNEAVDDIQLQAWRLARELDADVPKPDPVYDNVYRPDYQFSIYDLTITELRRTTEHHETIDIYPAGVPPQVIHRDQALDLVYSLYVDENERLPLWAEENLVFAFGDSEVTATLRVDEATGTDTLTWDNPDQLQWLDAEDLLTVRLYANHDQRNLLWEFALEAPLIDAPRPETLVKFNRQVDRANNWVSTSGGVMSLVLNDAADVTITVGGEGSVPAITVVSDQAFTAGAHAIAMPDDLAPGVYPLSVEGVRERDGHEELVDAFYRVQVKDISQQSLGQAIEENVNLFDGHLLLSRTDITIASRGPDLVFRRTLSSRNLDDDGGLGSSWTHNQLTRLEAVGSGILAVSGGAGGARFFPVAGESGRYRPGVGYHSNLIRTAQAAKTDPDGDDEYDFFTKDGTRHHFKAYPFSRRQPLRVGQLQQWWLEYSEDPNGNRLRYEYNDAETRFAQLTRVIDSSGRTLDFEYAVINGPSKEPLSVISAIDGPETTVRYAYDEVGHLIQATVNGAVERYSYALPAAGATDAIGPLYTEEEMLAEEEFEEDEE